MGKSPNSNNTTVSSARPGEVRHGYRSSSRVTSRVRPPSIGVSCQAQLLSGLAHSSHRLASNAVTLNAVVSLTVADIGTQSPVRMAWNWGRMRSALRRPWLSNRS
jgi:hypothetical protein